MKKQYSKPGIIIEEFKMAESIAVACEGVEAGGHGGSLGDATYSSKYSCGWRVGSYVYWTSTDNGCNLIRDENYVLNKYCYNNPVAGMSIFSSI